jgi:uncharacterized protein (DUF58 family)
LNWHKYPVEDRKISGSSTFAALLFCISLFLNLSLVFFLAVFFLLAVYANQLYFKKIGDQLIFENNLQRSYFFINQDGEWTLVFHNNGLPILNGEARIFFDHIVVPWRVYGINHIYERGDYSFFNFK